MTRDCGFIYSMPEVTQLNENNCLENGTLIYSKKLSGFLTSDQ